MSDLLRYSHDAKTDITGLADFKDSLNLLKPGIINLVDCKGLSSSVDRILEEIKATDALKRGGLLALFSFGRSTTRAWRRRRSTWVRAGWRPMRRAVS